MREGVSEREKRRVITREHVREKWREEGASERGKARESKRAREKRGMQGETWRNEARKRGSESENDRERV